MNKKKSNKGTTTEELALMIGKGFEHMDSRIDKIDNELEKVEMKLDNLENINMRDHEDIKMRLDNVAYRFELVALEKRVERLEKIDLINTSKLPK
ncbi:MAG: hypothetical protein WC788_03890 [Candidatus Paceibacterota bacterium]|jgi:dynactin complex subunit